MTQIPIAQFPDIVPPQIAVTANYAGASAEVVEATVAQPIESRVIGVDRMLYMKSTSGNDGSYTLTVTFAVGTDPDLNTVKVQNRVGLAEPQLAMEVRSPGRQRDQEVVGAAADRDDDVAGRALRPALPQPTTRPSTSSTASSACRASATSSMLTPADYSMKVWLNTDRMTSLGLTPSDIANAIRSQNVQAAVGRIGAQPALPDQQFQLTIQTKGRLSSVDEFGSIVVRANPDGSFVRVRDVARVELGARGSESLRPAGRRSGRGDGHLSDPRRQRDQQRRPDSGDARTPEALVPGGRRLQDHLRHHDLRQGEHQQRPAHAVRGVRPGRDRRLSFPRQFSRHPDPDDCRAGVADRHVRGDAGARLLGQHRVAAGPGAGDRHRGRRRDRRRRGGRGRNSKRTTRSHRPKRRGAR